jgi:hypothetical protein
MSRRDEEELGGMPKRHTNLWCRCFIDYYAVVCQGFSQPRAERQKNGRP